MALLPNIVWDLRSPTRCDFRILATTCRKRFSACGGPSSGWGEKIYEWIIQKFNLSDGIVDKFYAFWLVFGILYRSVDEKYSATDL